MNPHNYSGLHRGIIIANNDPDGMGRVKVFVPSVNVSMFENWFSKDSEATKKFSGLGANLESSLTPEIMEKLHMFLPWSEVAQPIFGMSSGGQYNAGTNSTGPACPAPAETAPTSDSGAPNPPAAGQTPAEQAAASTTPSKNTGENGKLDPNNLASIGQGHKLNAEAGQAYNQMKADAKAQGIDWSVTDSYRTYDAQVRLAQQKGLYKNGGLAATPGTSQHGWGKAVDLEYNKGSSTQAQTWLKNNASKYGFKTIPREPWHWEYTK